MSPIISVHLPKTAGSSFGKALEEYYADEFLPDYTSEPLAQDVYERRKNVTLAAIHTSANGIGRFRCIHGHFFPFKYLLLAAREPLTFAVWLRHPVNRVISHYHYWMNTEPQPSAIPLHKTVFNERWSFAQFGLLPRLRNIYTQYLWAFPLEQFDFIGITEHYREDLLDFSDLFLNDPLPEYHANAYSISEFYPSISDELREQITEYHAADIALYQRALSLRESRRSAVRE